MSKSVRIRTVARSTPHPLAITRVRRISGAVTDDQLWLAYDPSWHLAYPEEFAAAVAQVRALIADGEFGP